MTFSPPATSGPPPGWYLEHGSQQWLWWDGWQWVHPAAPVPEPEPAWFPPTPTLRLPAAILGIGFVVALTLATRLAVLLPTTPEAIVQLVLLGVSTIGMPAAAWYGSRRWGTGNLVHDLGFRIRWIDLALGLGGAIALTIALMIINVISHVIGIPNGSNLTEVSRRGRDIAVFLTLFVTAGIIAPLTEELLFRGLILRGLSSRWSTWGAVGLQAAVFGAAHITPSEGWGNVDLIVSLGVMGLGLGALAKLTGRLGTGMVAHAVFNCIQLALLWLTLG